MTCHGVHANSLYLRLSSILNILSVASPSGKQEELVDSLRVTGLAVGTALQQSVEGTDCSVPAGQLH